MLRITLISLLVACSNHPSETSPDAAACPADLIDNDCATYTHYLGATVYCADGTGVCVPSGSGAVCKAVCGGTQDCYAAGEMAYSIATCAAHACYCAQPGTTTP